MKITEKDECGCLTSNMIIRWGLFANTTIFHNRCNRFESAESNFIAAQCSRDQSLQALQVMFLAKVHCPELALNSANSEIVHHMTNAVYSLEPTKEAWKLTYCMGLYNRSRIINIFVFFETWTSKILKNWICTIPHVDEQNPDSAENPLALFVTSSINGLNLWPYECLQQTLIPNTNSLVMSCSGGKLTGNRGNFASGPKSSSPLRSMMQRQVKGRHYGLHCALIKSIFDKTSFIIHSD